MATVTAVTPTALTTNVTAYASGSFTPTAGDLLLVGAIVSATAVAAPTCTASANGITFTRIDSGAFGSNAHLVMAFVANQLVGGSPVAMTVTVDVTGDAGTGCVIMPLQVAGMTQVGTLAIRSSGKQINQAGPATPAVTLSNTALTTNPCIGWIGVEGLNPAAITPPSTWTEGGDTGYGTPTMGAEFAFINSGFTSNTVTWGSSTSIFGDIAVELDASGGAPAATSDVGVLFSSRRRKLPLLVR